MEGPGRVSTAPTYEIELAPSTNGYDYKPDDEWIQYVDPDPINVSAETAPALPTPVDWPTFWTRDRSADDWIIPQIVPAGRLVTLWAKRKTGKSLLTLDLAASAATGRPILGQTPGPPIDVIYCDMEMTEDDLEERLVDLGYGPHDDLSHFHYYLLPTLPPLDDYAGGQALIALVHRHQAQLVVIDTMARAVAGEENSADTYRRFYRATGMLLKQAGVAAIRLDHAGKETDRGERGSSAKGDDVDLSWELRDAGGNEYLLKRSYTRISWVPEQLKLRREIEPLRHVISQDDWPAGTKACADHLDRLQIPLDATITAAQKALQAADLSPRAKQIVGAAQRWRRHPDHNRTAPEPPAEPLPISANGTEF